MRAFLIFCLIGLSWSADEGYNYEQPAGSSAGGDFALGTSLDPSSVVLNSENGAAGQTSRASYGGTKTFYTVVAADDDDIDDDDDDFDSTSGPKNVDIVLAQAPAPSLRPVLKAFQNHAANQGTAVYILNKKLGANEISDALQRSNIRPSKPEVHFIKFKTPEEADHAQDLIRTQYDALGGSSELQDAGSAPVQSVIGSLGNGRRKENNERLSDAQVDFTSKYNGRFATSGGLFGSATSLSALSMPSLSNRYLPPRN